MNQSRCSSSSTGSYVANFSQSENFLQKNTKFRAENAPFWGKLGGELNFWLPIISCVGNL